MLSTVIETLYLALKKVRDYLALTMHGFLKYLQTYYYQRDETNQKDLGCWQEPSEDIKEMIVKHMSFSGRVRLSSLCKAWRLVSMRRDIRAPPQLPWLVHPQVQMRCHSLSFSSLSEGKVFKLRLPYPDFKSRLMTLVPRCFQVSIFRDSSKGWLVMLEWETELNFRKLLEGKTVIYLVNPVSGAQHRLPPLQTIPSYKEDSLDSIIEEVVLSSPDISQCLVAAHLGKGTLLLCRPRHKSWNVFQVLDENDILGTIEHILFSSTGMLYALVRGSGIAADHTLKFGDDEVKLKLIYEKDEWWIDDSLMGPEEEAYACRSYLLESTNNEMLLIHQISSTDVDEEEGNEDNEDNEEGNNNNNNNNGEENESQSVFRWAGQILLNAMQLKSFCKDDKQEERVGSMRTKYFRVYKIDPDNNNFRRVQNLGDQILFLAEDNSSLSLLASDFKELRGNCIYFATRGCRFGNIPTTREIGIFYLDSERIERSFPSLEMRRFSRLSWFTPSLW